VVPPLKETVNNEKVLSVRERMEQHRQSAACSGCHKIMDPIGLTLENFDAIGRWRVNDGPAKVDPTSEMYDGAKLDGPVSLRRAVLSRPNAFLESFTENLLAYGVGRILVIGICQRCGRSLTRPQRAKTAFPLLSSVLSGARHSR